MFPAVPQLRALWRIPDCVAGLSQGTKPEYPVWWLVLSTTRSPRDQISGQICEGLLSRLG